MALSYTMELTREGKWWVVYVPEIDHATQARTLPEADEMARDLIQLVEEDHGVELAPAAIELHQTVHLPDQVASHLRQADQLRQQARTTQQSALREQSSAVRELRKAGVSLRDAGVALGLSHQRVSQLANLETGETELAGR